MQVAAGMKTIMEMYTMKIKEILSSIMLGYSLRLTGIFDIPLLVKYY